MSNPIKELRKLLGHSPDDESGVVTSVTPTAVSVRCRSGVRQVTSSVPVAVGDSVLISNGNIHGKLQHQDDLRHYYL